ncbi:glycoside hydrolase family 5 protein [Cerasicoccus frondis]|uniref:glycoside hydrolase family 5 protein n=1 Tax=Cerasicoccus frondis TaxID=490090 RepID=UPI0028524D95|nr:cellulase family glycosylhydrolase [Cerasicoccus frondis]
MKFIFALFLVAFAQAIHAETDLLPPLLSNGDFEAGAEDWPLPEGASIEVEADGNHYLRLQYLKPDYFLGSPRSIPLLPELQALRLSYRVRYENVQQGKKQWHDGRIIIDFKDANGKRIGGASPPYFKRTAKDWKTRSQDFVIPHGATTLEIIPVLFHAKSGTLEFDDFVLTPIDAAPVIAQQAAASQAREAEQQRRAALVKPSVTRPAADDMPAALRVQGNQIVTDEGEVVWLQGVNVPSLEWVSGGEHILRSIEVALTDWQANCIRLPVKGKFWAGKGPYQKDGGAAYRQLIEDAANLCATHDAYLILDLHHFRAPEPTDADFWHEAATRFKNHPAVLFDLLNEPHDITWEVWRNGGPTGSQKVGVNADEVGDGLRDFDSIGMQALVDTVRETGAENIVIVGGLDWGYDLSGVLDGYALQDPSGRGIVYSSHFYPWKNGWQKAFLDVAEKYPVIIGEVGIDSKLHDFQNDQQEAFETWVPDALGVIQKHRLHWTAWTFHHKATPRLILDLDTYEPTPFWGTHAQAALAGEQFELKALR